MTDHENNNSISRNPFAALFSSVADARHFAEIQKQTPTPPAGERGGGAAGRGAGWRTLVSREWAGGGGLA